MTFITHKSSLSGGWLSSVETSESADRFQRNAARASCIQNPLFLWNSDGISTYQYVLHTKYCRCKIDFSSRIGSLSDLRPPLWLSSITLRYATLSRIPLNQGSARTRSLPENTQHSRDIHLDPAGFEHTNPLSQRSRTRAFDHMAPVVETRHWLNILHNCGIRRKRFDRA